MKECPKCKKQNIDEAEFCGFCGFTLSTKGYKKMKRIFTTKIILFIIAITGILISLIPLVIDTKALLKSGLFLSKETLIYMHLENLPLELLNYKICFIDMTVISVLSILLFKVANSVKIQLLLMPIFVITCIFPIIFYFINSNQITCRSLSIPVWCMAIYILCFIYLATYIILLVTQKKCKN